MYCKRKLFLLVSTLIFVASFSKALFAQDSDRKINMPEQEQVLQGYFELLASADSDSKRDSLNKLILEKFRTQLTHAESFAYPFDSISNAGILMSPDEKVKLYNWNVPYEAGYHVYYCFVQYQTGDSLLTFELNDQSEQIDKPEEKALSKENWFGALYYKIISKKGRFDETYYTLLGFDLNDYLTNKKVVDVLHFDKNNQPVFGANIFKNQREITRRIIFEYAEFASMTLQYEEEKDMIVYDHLSPSKPRYEGQYEFYGPDFSYDGLKFENGIWNTYFDLDPRLNNINLND